MTLKRGYAMTSVFFVLSLICVVVTEAAERQIKKAKIDEKAVTSVLCPCDTCAHMRRDARQWEDRELVIAQALLLINLPKNLADIIYQYVDYYPMGSRWQWDIRGHAFSFANHDQKLVHLRLVTNAPLDDTQGKQKIIHIVPQEVCFNYDDFTRAHAILYNSASKEHHAMTIRSLCNRYYMQCKSYCEEYFSPNIIVSPYCPNISQSPGWNRALAEIKSKE